MAKKKKTQLKPVARGFATTSLPKKVVPAQEEEETTSCATPEQGGVTPESGSGAEAALPNGPGEQIKAQAPDEFDPEKVEEQSLQNLVDKLQEKTEKDIKRTVKVITYISRRGFTCSSWCAGCSAGSSSCADSSTT